MNAIFQAVGKNYKAWLGEPSRIIQPEKQYPELATNFSILCYQRENHWILATLGASERVIPGSYSAFEKSGGSSQEYLYIHLKKACKTCRMCC